MMMDPCWFLCGSERAIMQIGAMNGSASFFFFDVAAICQPGWVQEGSTTELKYEDEYECVKCDVCGEKSRKEGAQGWRKESVLLLVLKSENEACGCMADREG